jgi:hypothetical protein
MEASHGFAHQNCLLENIMLRLLKALALTLALTVLSLFTVSCGNGNNAQVRIFNAVPNAGASLDVDINGNKITGTTPLVFASTFPSGGPPATYASVASGNDSIAAFITGTTVNPVNNGNATLNGSTQYTVLLQGFASAVNTPVVLTDNNTAPTSGDFEFRVINGSPSSPSGSVDVYIFLTGGLVPTQPQISGLGLGQASPYLPFTFSSGGGYTVVVTPHGSTTEYVNQNYTPANGSITTLVLIDILNGGSLSPVPIQLNDLN